MPLPMPELPGSPDDAGDERATLTSYLDFQRGVMLRKVADLDDEALRRPMTPSGLTLLGMLKHLAFVERYWFQEVFAGRTVEYPWTDDDPDADWRAEPDETAERIAELYRGECEIARGITAAGSLDDIVTRGNERVSLRSILTHMIEETARHLGHADIMREAIDGQTGD
jgi:uncharacterized damage-inducible protein DinB